MLWDIKRHPAAPHPTSADAEATPDQVRGRLFSRKREKEDALRRETYPLATIAKIKSAYRLVALDPAAFALGLRPMTALADARAMHQNLAVHDADPQGDAAALDAIVDWCRLFTPLAAPDGLTADGQGGAILDISGAAHLFGGETALMATMVQRLARQGFAATVAVAGTPDAAWALARYGNGRRLVADDTLPADCEKIFAPMPLAALRLDEEIIARLAQAGLRRVSDLLLRPRAPIAARFGRGLYDRLDALLGRVKNPISPRFEAPPFVAERRFAEGIARHEDVEATISALAADLCGLLARHGEGARRLDVSLFRVDGVVKHIGVGTSRPLRDPAVMARLFRERIAAAGEEGLDTGYGFDVVRLAALAAEKLDPAQPGWDEAGASAADLADLIDRLGARFGLERVARLGFGDSHQPEKASAPTLPSPACGRRWPDEVGSDEGRCHLLPNAWRSGTAPHPTLADARATFSRKREKDYAELPTRPLRLLESPEPIRATATVPDGPPRWFCWRRVQHDVTAAEGPERIGPDWWGPNPGAPRDYFRAEDSDGRRFWLYREGLYRETSEVRWFVHGVFA